MVQLCNELEHVGRVLSYHSRAIGPLRHAYYPGQTLLCPGTELIKCLLTGFWG